MPIAAIVAALFTLGIAQPSDALPGLATSTAAKAGEVQCNYVTAAHTAPFIEKVWRLIRWQREKPKPSTVRAYRNKLRCAGPGNRKALKHRWRSTRRAFYEHRRSMLEVIVLTPYECGEGIRSAIPCYIPACESHLSWSALNPSGAVGFYQIMPATMAAAAASGIGDGSWSHKNQHRVARWLWLTYGPSQWVCA